MHSMLWHKEYAQEIKHLVILVTSQINTTSISTATVDDDTMATVKLMHGNSALANVLAFIKTANLTANE